MHDGRMSAPPRRRGPRKPSTVDRLDGKSSRAPRGHELGDGHFRARRFDADKTDVILAFDQAMSSKLSDRQLLWMDVVGMLEGPQADAITERFQLDARTRRALEHPGSRPHLALNGMQFHVRVRADPDAGVRSDPGWLDVIAGDNVVLTRHTEAIAFLDDIDERIDDDTTIGVLDATTFVATLLDATVTEYFSAVDVIEDEIDKLDGRSLRNTGRGAVLQDLVGIRRRIARLRRVLSEHRAVYAGLAGPAMVEVAGTADAAAALRAVAGRFEAALQAVEDSRELLLGSFDVQMSLTAQRTNDVMKLLALATVLLLPGSVIAGLMGMNVVVPLSKDDPASFWIVVAGFAILATIVLVVARVRRWL
jgi:magnesium transporter